jgi:hypothetical protein
LKFSGKTSADLIADSVGGFPGLMPLNQDSTSSEISTTLYGVTSSVIFSESNVTPKKVIFVVGVTALSAD